MESQYRCKHIDLFCFCLFPDFIAVLFIKPCVLTILLIIFPCALTAGKKEKVTAEMKRAARKQREAEREEKAAAKRREREEIFEVGEEGMSLEALAEAIQVDPSDIMRTLFMKGIMLSMNQVRKGSVQRLLT